MSHFSRSGRKRKVNFVRPRRRSGINWPVSFRSDTGLDSRIDFTTRRHWSLPNVEYFCCCGFPVASSFVNRMVCSNAVRLSPKIHFALNRNIQKFQPPVRSIGNCPIVLESTELFLPIPEQSRSRLLPKTFCRSLDIVSKIIHSFSLHS